MSFSNIIKRKNKFLLPFSWVYKAGVVLHHKFYEWGFMQTEKPALPLICVGNLAVGGTGKTPMVEYLLRLLTPNYKVATISRGYKRKSKGVVIANDETRFTEIGDEPMQFHTKFPQAKIVVGEKRINAINELMQQFPATDVIILDDAFQHKAVQAGLNILLTEYDNLFTNDYYLPAGQLRDLKGNYKKADIIIVTKCPETLTMDEKHRLRHQIKPLSHQTIYYTSIRYGEPVHISTNISTHLTSVKNVLLITGIANPEPLIAYLKRHDISLKVNSFPDHHQFNQSDINHLKKSFHNIKGDNKIIITTEKDAMRFKQFETGLEDLPFFAIPIEHNFLFNEAQSFNDKILLFIKNKNNYAKEK